MKYMYIFYSGKIRLVESEKQKVTFYKNQMIISNDNSKDEEVIDLETLSKVTRWD